MINAVLPDTSLCAIVRDEMINPAGGIISFIEAAILHVEKAVIVDTGSVDETLNVLNDMQAKYSHLSVYSRPFKDFASSRNWALDQIKTKNVLILDADERISEENFVELRNIMIENPRRGYNLPIIKCLSDGSTKKLNAANNPRIFRLSDNIIYVNMNGNRYEVPYLKEWETFMHWPLRHATPEVISLEIPIMHYCATEESLKRKEDDWYVNVVNRGDATPPSQVKSFKEWKSMNPHAIK